MLESDVLEAARQTLSNVHPRELFIDEINADIIYVRELTPEQREAVINAASSYELLTDPEKLGPVYRRTLKYIEKRDHNIGLGSQLDREAVAWCHVALDLLVDNPIADEVVSRQVLLGINITGKNIHYALIGQKLDPFESRSVLRVSVNDREHILTRVKRCPVSKIAAAWQKTALEVIRGQQ